MEARIARIESDVAHLRSDIAEIKTDLRGLRDTDLRDLRESDTRLRDKIDDLRDSLASARVWALFLYIGLAAVNLGALARGLGWI